MTFEKRHIFKCTRIKSNDVLIVINFEQISDIILKSPWFALNK